MSVPSHTEPARQREAIAELGRRAVDVDDVDRFLADAVRTVGETLDAGHCAAFERRAGDAGLRCRATAGSPVSADDGSAEPHDVASFAEAVLSSSDPVRREDGHEDGEDQARADREADRSAIGAVVGDPDDPWGVLVATSRGPRPFTDYDGSFLETVANTLGLGIDAARSRNRLEERERITAALVDASSAGVVVIDRASDTHVVNDAAVELLGRSREEILYMNAEDWDIVDADGEPVSPDRTPFAAVMAGDEPIEDLEFGVRRPEGKRVWLSISASRIRDGDGRPTGCAFVFEDVTGERNLEGELEEIYGRVSDAFFALDEAWNFTYLNERAHELINPEGRQLEGTNVWERFPETAERKFREKYEEAMYEQEPVSFEEYYPEPLDAWFEVHAYPSETGLSVYFRDVTERVERERELERYETIVETISDGVYVVDEDGRFTMVNDAYVELTGYSREELLGSHVSLVGDEETVQRAAEVEAALEAGDAEAPVIEAEIVTASGERVPSEATFALLPETEDGRHRVGVARDVSDKKERERRLRESERRYRTLAESFPNGIVTLFDTDGVYTLAAGRGFEEIPVEPADLEDEHFADVWDDSTASALEPVFEAALAGEERRVELAYADREWVVRGVPITDEDGEVFAGMTMAQDITERKKRERYFREAKSQLEAATEAGAIGTWEWDVTEDRFVAGPTFARTFDVDPEDAREGVSIDRFVSAIHEDDRDRVRAEIDEAIETCGDYEAEYRVRNADGEVRWVVARGTVQCDESGDPQTFPGAVTDITERKRAELDLQRTTDQLESLFEILPVGVVVADVDGRLVEANEAAKEIWGGDVFDARSVDEYDRYTATWEETGEPVDPHEWPMARVLEGEEITDPDVFEIEAADGERRVVRIQGAPVRDEDGEIVRGVVTQTDVTERRESQRRLAESERRYRTLVENFPDGAVGLLDENLEYVAVGGKLLDEVGVDPDERIGNDLADVYPADLVAEIEPKFRTALAGEATTFETQFHDRYLLAHTLPVEGDDDEVDAVMLVVQDVTERREMERELRESERRLRMIAENLEEIVWLSAPDTLEFLYVNPAYEDVWGRDPETLYEDTYAFADGLHPEDRDRVTSGFRALPEEDFDDEFRIVRPDGEVRWVEAQATPVRDEAGDVQRIVGIGQDVTERKERERALEESERRYRTLAEHFPQGAVGVYDLELRYTLTEGAVLGETLPAKDRLEGDRMPEIFPDHVVEDLEPLFRAAIESGETDSATTEFGGRNWRVWATPLRTADGEIYAGLSIAQDITEQIERQRELEASNERLEQFAYAASHDLQEPLRMVSSYLRLIENRYAEELDEDGREFIEYAVDGADRMRDMIDGLLEYSRVDSRGDPLEPVDLEAVLADVRENLQLKIEEHDATIAADSLPTVRGDAGQLRQVFQNLLDNAIEYSGDEPPRIEIDAARDGDEWVISVRDEGVGIDPAEADRVFDVFQSLHDRETHSGTGIGLALCERILERHGGDIWVESEPGAGSTFSFTLEPTSESNE